jgi:predicted Fe-Mo cluster-binding NifX family protein
MKIAITSTGDHPGAILDHRFGRCSYFVVYDTESKLMDFIPNPNKEIMEGAALLQSSWLHLTAYKK